MVTGVGGFAVAGLTLRSLLTGSLTHTLPHE
jgi:hypothetical protein